MEEEWQLISEQFTKHISSMLKCQGNKNTSGASLTSVG